MENMKSYLKPLYLIDHTFKTSGNSEDMTARVSYTASDVDVK